MKNYQNMVYTTAIRIVGNDTDAADISQEVFLKAYERFAELSPNERAGGWLKTVARNLSLNHVSRYRSRWRFFSELKTEDSGEEYVDTLAAPGQNVSNLDQEQRQQWLEETLQKLPASQRVPLVLYHFEEMSYEEIAKRLKISLGKVKTDIHRSRETLRKILQTKPDLDLGLTS